MTHAPLFVGMNHRREYERLDRVMGVNTALQRLGIKRHQLSGDRLKLAVKQRCEAIRNQSEKFLRDRDYQEMEEARGVLLGYLETVQQTGVQMELFEVS